MICSYCGTETPDESELCRSCGARIKNQVDEIKSTSVQSDNTAQEVRPNSPTSNEKAKKNKKATAGFVLSLVSTTLPVPITAFLLFKFNVDILWLLGGLFIVCITVLLPVQVSLVLSILGLSDSINKNLPNKKLAIAGIIISATKSTLLLIAMTLLFIFSIYFAALFILIVEFFRILFLILIEISSSFWCIVL